MDTMRHPGHDRDRSARFLYASFDVNMSAGLVQAKAEAAIRAVGLTGFLSIPDKSSVSGSIVAADADQQHELQPRGHLSAAGGAADGGSPVRAPVRQHRLCII